MRVAIAKPWTPAKAVLLAANTGKVGWLRDPSGEHVLVMVVNSGSRVLFVNLDNGMILHAFDGDTFIPVPNATITTHADRSMVKVPA